MPFSLPHGLSNCFTKCCELRRGCSCTNHPQRSTFQADSAVLQTGRLLTALKELSPSDSNWRVRCLICLRLAHCMSVFNVTRCLKWICGICDPFWPAIFVISILFSIRVFIFCGRNFLQSSDPPTSQRKAKQKIDIQFVRFSTNTNFVNQMTANVSPGITRDRLGRLGAAETGSNWNFERTQAQRGRLHHRAAKSVWHKVTYRLMLKETVTAVTTCLTFEGFDHFRIAKKMCGQHKGQSCTTCPWGLRIARIFDIWHQVAGSGRSALQARPVTAEWHVPNASKTAKLWRLMSTASPQSQPSIDSWWFFHTIDCAHTLWECLYEMSVYIHV